MHELESPRRARREASVTFPVASMVATSFLRHRDDITHLLLVRCFDDDVEDDAAWARSIEARTRFAEHYGKALVWLDTNVRSILEANGVSWQLAFGPVICSAGTLFGDRKNYVSSGYPYDDLHPDGVHPLLDPLWSTSASAVVHVGGGHSRTDKTVYISRDQFAVDNLQVCWKHSDCNCGHCPKCVRTGLTLYLVGKKSVNIPFTYTGDASIQSIKPREKGNVTFLEDLIELAWDVGNQEVADKLQKMRKRFLVRNALDELAKAILPRYIARRLRAQQNWVQSMQPVSFTSTSKFL